MNLQIILGLMLISSTALALYPAANYDSIVKSSVLIHKPGNHHEQNHVINRNGAFLITNFKKPEQPHRALVIHKPVLITSLSNKPATIIETHKNHEAIEIKQLSKVPCDEEKVKNVIITQKQPVFVYSKPITTEKPVVHEEKHVDEPVKFTINIEQPKPSIPAVTKQIYTVQRPNIFVPFGYNAHSNQAHSQLFFNKIQQPTNYFYAPQVQPVIPQRYAYGYAIYGNPSTPNIVPKPNFEYISKPSYEYGVPKENATVPFVSKEIPYYSSHHNVLPLPVRHFGYSFNAAVQPPAPQKVVNVPNFVYGAPEHHSVYQPNIKPTPVRQFGYSFTTPEKPIIGKPINVYKPTSEYGVPKLNIIENNKIQPPQKFGYSYTIYNQPATGKTNPKPSTEYGAPKLIRPVPKPSTEYGVPKLIQPVPKPSTEYGVPKVSNFGPIVVAPFDAPFATNQHLPFEGKHIQFTSS